MKVKEPLSGVPDSSTSGMASDGFVAAGSTVSVSHDFDRNTVVSRLYARAYYGHEKNVNYRVYITRGESGQKIDLIQTVAGSDSTNAYLSGNGETFDLDLHQPVNRDDTLTFEITNNDTVEAQPVNLYVTTEYDLPSVAWGWL